MAISTTCSPARASRGHSNGLRLHVLVQAADSAALAAECAANGGVAPDAYFLCAGDSHPGFWVECDEEKLVKSMEQTYWVQAWSAHVSFLVLCF